MRLNEVSVPQVYKQSQDFRFFLKWFELCLSQIQYDIENMYDLYDPLRCKTNLLWMLADTMGFKYDDRMYPAFNRLVLLYFMDMIRSRGSKDGMLIAGQVNLAQKTILKKYEIHLDEDTHEYVSDWEDLDEIYEDRLYSSALPANSVYVNSVPSDGYIDVVYFADSVPTDTCIEYVRPIGMYCFQTPGVRYDARTRISVDARLVDEIRDIIEATDVIYDSSTDYPPGPTRVADYTDEDYSTLQDYNGGMLKPRSLSYYRNSTYEKTPTVDAGYRTLYSLQLSNTESNARAALRGNNQAENLMGVNWVDTGVSLEQLANEFDWNLPEPIYENPEATSNDDISVQPNTNMGALGDTLS